MSPGWCAPARSAVKSPTCCSAMTVCSGTWASHPTAAGSRPPETMAPLRLWPMPDMDRRPSTPLPYDELLDRLRALTNLRAVEDEQSPTGYSVEAGPFPGWETVPEW